MALTSEEVNNQHFTIDRKGYNVDEVDVFLDTVAASLDELNAQIDTLSAQAQEALLTPAPAPAPVVEAEEKPLPESASEKDARIRELEALVAEHKKEDAAIAQALIIAQRSADDVLAKAHDAAEATRLDAEHEAARIIDKANAEKQRIMDEIARLEEDREASRARYTEMLNDFIASSQEILGELTDKGAQYAAARGSHGAYAYTPSAAAARNAQVNATPAASSAPATTSSAPAFNLGATQAVNPVSAKPSQVEKDFSGFGDTDSDFEFDDID